MTTLTYPFLGDAVKVGQPLGCDPTGWPYRVEFVQHWDWWDRPPTNPEPGPLVRTTVTVEPWPLLSPVADQVDKLVYVAAMAHARERMAGVLR